jgi:uncharacterized membrane protein YkvA (DUF1232 family)
MTLFSMVAEVADQIEDLEEKETITTLTEHNFSVNPEGCEKLAEEYRKETRKKSSETDSTAAEATPENAAITVAYGQFTYLKTIPGLVTKIIDVINQREAKPAVRLALSGTLTYFVKPKDIMPDNIPDGIGFLDDAVVIYSVTDPNMLQAILSQDVYQNANIPAMPTGTFPYGTSSEFFGSGRIMTGHGGTTVPFLGGGGVTMTSGGAIACW